MLNSADRMSFIIEYISAYEEKIKLANNNGLFDNAKLFEVFAIEICKLWFNQEFSNLNDVKLNFSYVDLISADKKLYVQVTTNQNVPQKIKSTLEKINNSTDTFFSNITNVIFFVLSNDSVNKLKDYTGKDRIGNIDFTVKNNLISTNDIISRATSDADFQEKLYLLLKSDFDSFESNSKRLFEAIELSKIGIENIDSKINNEFEINREDLINHIIEEDEKYISIQGEAGSGKSVLCKKLVEDKDIILYARSERFLEESDINRIWNFELIQTLNYINNKNIIFFIDALEFIADSSKSKLDLLDRFYHICSQYDNVKVITSCRSTDKSAFIHIEAKHSIKTYECPLLSDAEIEEIAQEYPIIRQAMGITQYASLIRTPFYINLLVTSISDINNIKDINEFRNYIWTNIICIKNKSNRYNLKSNEIVDTVNYIVMERAKKFLVGIHTDRLQADILEALKSEGVVIENNHTVRLKYDIFEDICFENYFDIQFDECQCDYNTFFGSIESLGRCVYRRYQIWVSNKILAKPNREKFIYSLLFSNNLPDSWRIQTEIGLIKSNYSQSFFDEYIDCIIENDLLFEFIQTTNLYAFNTRIIKLSDDVTDILLEPCGVGRSKLLNCIFEKELYKNKDLKQYILKLCDDFSNQKQTSAEDKGCVCNILEYYVDELFSEVKQAHIRNFDKNICELLLPIYRMADISKEWINQFFGKLITGAKSDNHSLSRVCEKVIDFTLKKTPQQLIANMTESICNLAEMYWTYSTQEKHTFISHDIFDDKYNIYGLNENAQNYEHNYRTIYDCAFLCLLFKTKLIIGLRWSVNFLNKLMANYNGQQKDDVIDIVKNKEMKQYIGNELHWFAGIKEHRLPMIIGDIIYWIKSELISYGEYLLSKTNQEQFTSVFLAIQEFIYKKSNNVLLLSIVATVGMYFRRKLPTYALDLASNIDVLFWDLHRYVELQDNPVRKRLEERILLAVGLPDLPKRYHTQFNKDISLRNYVFELQFYGNDRIKEKVFQLLDYLYSITPNNEEYAEYYLQIQNIDSRIAEVKQIDESTYSVETIPTGAAAKIVQRNEKKNRPQIELEVFIRDSLEKMISNAFTVEDVFSGINNLKGYIDNPIIRLSIEEYIIIFIIYALNKLNLSIEQRSELCDIWIDGIDKMFEGDSFDFPHPTIKNLFEQLEMDINSETQNQIKLLLLRLITECGQNGILLDLARYAKEYLYSNKVIARCVFNTILVLSTEENFKNNFKEITLTYLFNEESFDIHSIDFNNTDIRLICYISNCGLDLSDNDFSFVIKSQLIRMIDYWDSDEYTWRDLPFEATNELESFFESEIIRNAQLAYNCLFDHIDFSNFKREAIDFYHNIFSKLIVEFFDSHSDTKRRDNCKKSIFILEDKVNQIAFEGVKRELYKSLCLSPTHKMGDWSKFGVGYSYADKCFINELLSKYGKYNMESTLYTVYQLQIKHLMPEILISLNVCFEAVRNDGFENVSRIINSPAKAVIDNIIITAFLKYNDHIKADIDLCQSYEGLLETLVFGHYEKAAVLLDEFRIH